MSADNPSEPERPVPPELAEALHRVLDRDAPEPAEELIPPEGPDRDRFVGALHVAGLLDELVRHVESEAGVNFLEQATTAWAPELAPGTVPQPFPDEYRFRELLGSGTFGQVWLADDLKLGIPVAVKRVCPQGDVARRSRALVALQREAQILARLKHPNVVRVYALRRTGDEQYLVMQYVRGRSLQSRLESGPLPWRVAARFVADAAEAIGHVHALGIIHRDVKPANLLWDETTDEILLTDFGVSAWLAEEVRGDVAGTALYMAPEALLGRAEPASDVYALAATLFHLITGAPPFAALSWPELAARITEGLDDPDPRCAAMPERLERVIRGALAPDPARRTGLTEFATGLRGCLNQLLADNLVPRPGADPRADATTVRVSVSRRGADGRYTQLAAAQRSAPRVTRNLDAVPPEPDSVVLRTGDRVRVVAGADRDGHLTVFNVGPTGDLSVLYPLPGPRGASGVIPANQPVVIAEVEAHPPAGSERVFAVWSRGPLTLPLLDVARQAADEIPVSRAYRATRNLVLVEASVRELAADDWQAAVLELEHRPV